LVNSKEKDINNYKPRIFKVEKCPWYQFAAHLIFYKRDKGQHNIAYGRLTPYKKIEGVLDDRHSGANATGSSREKN
jgi:hypothetical protein